MSEIIPNTVDNATNAVMHSIITAIGLIIVSDELTIKLSSSFYFFSLYI